MELEARMLAESTKTEDGQAGIAAFVAKTKPVFLGK
jgi:enoyl-CoA hydratase/carnithine racemase